MKAQRGHDRQPLARTVLLLLPPSLQRILHVDYHIPPHVKASEECKDLLSRILVADPHKRITVDGIYNHKWYLKGLPPGVREMNDRVQPPPDGLQVGMEKRGGVQGAVHWQSWEGTRGGRWGAGCRRAATGFGKWAGRRR